MTDIEKLLRDCEKQGLIEQCWEIERLLLENEKLRAALASANEQLVRADLKITSLRAENEKLRAALKETLEIASRNEIGDYVQRAKAALGESDE